jgi:hypothetical protein
VYACSVLLDLLSTPASDLSLAHVAGGFNGRHKLEDDVSDTGDANNATGNVHQDGLAKEESADEDVEDTTSQEREEERGISRDLGRDLELEKRNGKTKDDHVHGEDDGLHVEAEDVHDAAEDGDGRDDQVNDAKAVGELHCVVEDGCLKLRASE